MLPPKTPMGLVLWLFPKTTGWVLGECLSVAWDRGDISKCQDNRQLFIHSFNHPSIHLFMKLMLWPGPLLVLEH